MDIRPLFKVVTQSCDTASTDNMTVVIIIKFHLSLLSLSSSTPSSLSLSCMCTALGFVSVWESLSLLLAYLLLAIVTILLCVPFLEYVVYVFIWRVYRNWFLLNLSTTEGLNFSTFTELMDHPFSTLSWRLWWFIADAILMIFLKI